MTSPHTAPDATLIIIGAGMAGGELAHQARQQGWQGRIVLLGSEPHLPYHRPMLSKAYLAGNSDASALLMRPDSAYAKANITVRTDCSVTRIDRPQRQIVLADGSRVAYDVLALCTGGRARPWECPGLVPHATNFHTLRTRDDADALRAHLRPTSRLAIIGGGYIGLEVAASARRLGAQVTVLEAETRLLMRSASTQLATCCAAVHRAHDVDIRTASRVVRVQCHAQGEISALDCDNGQTLAVDLVLAGIGMQPNVQLAHDAGLDIDGGIVVDTHGRTTDPHIFAAGDCTVYDSARYARRVHFESVPNALEQARAAAYAICNKAREHHSVPWFWSDQYDLKLQMAGLAHGHDATALRGNLAQGNGIVFYLRQDRVLAIEAVNRPADFMMGRKLIERDVAVTVEQLTDATIALRQLALG